MYSFLYMTMLLLLIAYFGKTVIKTKQMQGALIVIGLLIIFSDAVYIGWLGEALVTLDASKIKMLEIIENIGSIFVIVGCLIFLLKTPNTS